MNADRKLPKVVVQDVTMVHGYRGHPSVHIQLVCGHYQFRPEHEMRWRSFTKGKTKTACYDCRTAAVVKERLTKNGCEFRPCHGQASPCFEPCEKCNQRTPFEVRVGDRWAAWCGCGV